MSDRDLSAPFPDQGHEAIRQWLEQAIADLGLTTSDVDVSFELADMLFVLLADALAALAGYRSELAALAARVAALEPPPLPTP